MQRAAKKKPEPPLTRLYRHKPGCCCHDCVEALNEWVASTNSVSIAMQADELMQVIAEYDLPHLLPVLKTVQWVRDNHAVLKQRMTG